MDQQTNPTLFDLHVTFDAKAQLADSAKWAKFLAICGIIGIILLVGAGSYMALTLVSTDPELKEITRESSLSAEGLGAGIVVVYVLVGLLYFFPCLFLLQFANRMKIALSNGDDLMLAESFRSLKKTFRYLGVVTIIFLAFFVLGILGGALDTSTGR
jgi:hypothetical protein